MHRPNRRLDVGRIAHSVIKRLRNIISKLGYLNGTAHGGVRYIIKSVKNSLGGDVSSRVHGDMVSYGVVI